MVGWADRFCRLACGSDGRTAGSFYRGQSVCQSSPKVDLVFWSWVGFVSRPVGQSWPFCQLVGLPGLPIGRLVDLSAGWSAGDACAVRRSVERWVGRSRSSGWFVCQSDSWSVRQSVGPPVGRLIGRRSVCSAGMLVGRSIGHPGGRSMRWRFIGQPAVGRSGLSVCWSIGQSASRLVGRSFSLSICRLVCRSIDRPVRLADCEHRRL